MKKCECGSNEFYIEEKLSGTAAIHFNIEKNTIDYSNLYSNVEHKKAIVKICSICGKKTKFNYSEISSFKEE